MDTAPTLLLDAEDGALAAQVPALRALEPDTALLLVHQAAAALELLEARDISVVAMNFGSDTAARTAFCRAVAERRPATVRLAVVPALADLTECLRAGGPHYGFCARCDGADLLAALRNGRSVWRRIRSNPAIARVMSAADAIPTPPAMYFDIRDALQRESTTFATVVELVQRDAALAARTLKVANSGFYGVPRTVSDLETAIALVGTDMVLALALASHLLRCLPLPGVQLDRLWVHGVAVSSLARFIARQEGGSSEEVKASAIAGLLHDVGGLLLLAGFPADYQRILRRTAGDEGRLLALEQDTFGVCHPELGALLLSLWNLPEPVVRAIELHHRTESVSREHDGLVAFAVAMAEAVFLDMHAEGSQLAQETRGGPSTIGGRGLSHWRDAAPAVLARVAGRL